MTQVRLNDEIEPELSGNPLGFALRISPGLRLYFIVYPSPHHNTDILYSLGAMMAARETQLLVRDYKRMVICGKAFGGILANIVPREVPSPKTLGAGLQPHGFLALKLSRDNIYQYPLSFSTYCIRINITIRIYSLLVV